MTTLLKEFTTWVAAQPPRKRYNFADTRNCALAQWARQHFSAPYVVAGAFSVTIGEDAIITHTLWVHQDADVALAIMDSKTFGQLSRRLTLFSEKTNA